MDELSSGLDKIIFGHALQADETELDLDFYMSLTDR